MNISGSGIGLSMVKDIVEKVVGNFVIDSKINKYTTVILTIPLIKENDE